MWSSMVVLALPIALDPVRLGLNLLLISRPRPAQNLLVYWVGCAIASLLLLLVPILALHFIPIFSPFVHDLASPATTASATVRLLEVVAGVLVVVAAAGMALRFFARRRAQVQARGAHPSTVVVDSEPPNPLSRLLRRGRDSQDATGEGGFRSAIPRLLDRATNAWESGSLWVAFAIGVWAAPNPAFVVFGLATIATSGASIGTQIGAAAVFTAEALAVVEIVLLSNLVAPTKTEAVLRRLHDWARAYRRQILVAMLTLVGLALVAQGMGII
ncbi:MAG: GAP family protein [Mycobacterium sp.]|nr:GAP family protein [Mycobacterium sp.]MBV8294188.1 GAP family protein [Mycobacterium sp.]